MALAQFIIDMMDKKVSPKFWIKLGRALGIGILFGLVSYLIFGDSISAVLFLLIAYLEYRLSK